MIDPVHLEPVRDIRATWPGDARRSQKRTDTP